MFNKKLKKGKMVEISLKMGIPLFARDSDFFGITPGR